MKDYNFFIVFDDLAEEAIKLMEDLKKLPKDDIRLIFCEKIDAAPIKLDNINQSIKYGLSFIGELLGILPKDPLKEDKL